MVRDLRGTDHGMIARIVLAWEFQVGLSSALLIDSFGTLCNLNFLFPSEKNT